jgi:RNase P/RNase MRP subunit p30
MFIDVCIPNSNEEKFIRVAERLGTKGLLFLYEEKREREQKQRLDALRAKTKLKLYSGILAKSNTNTHGVVFAKGEQQNAENRNMKFLYGFEELEQKDSFHYRRSGANQVLCTIIKEKEKVLVFDMEKIIVPSRQREMLLGRMQQNLMLAKKYKLRTVICSFASKPENLRAEAEYASLIRSFSYEELAKQAVNNLFLVLEEKDE